MQREEEEDQREEWFETWFDTSYYHSLYKHRDEVEAKEFIMRLLRSLDVPQGAKVMDLACGKGRHSLTMHEAGLDVVGLDLSENSIDHLRKMKRPRLEFHQWDMRKPYVSKEFDYIFNLFTSFGYFSDIQDNLKVLQAIHFGLKPNGFLVLDYLNAAPLMSLVESEEKEEITRDGYHFWTSKKISKGQVVKHIRVLDKDETHHFEERVQLFKLSEMKSMLTEAGFAIREIYGSYELTALVEQSSDRMIIIAQKE